LPQLQGQPEEIKLLYACLDSDFFKAILALGQIGPVLSACCATPHAHCAMLSGERKWFLMIPHDTSSILASSQMEEVKL